MRSLTFIGLLLVLVYVVPKPVSAQSGGRRSLPEGSPYLRGVPAGTVTSEPLQLSLQDAVLRALDHNLGAIVAEQQLASAVGARTHARGELLPDLKASVSEARRTTNLEAFGFPLSPQFPRV